MVPLLIAAVFLSGTAHASAEEIVSIATRAGVTQAYLLSAPEAGKARAIALLFPGGAGKTDLEREVRRDTLDRGNFLVRSRRHFVAHGIVAAVVDSPSDQPSGMDDFFRLDRAHAEDITRIVADVKARFPGLPVFLVGTSRGTVSAAAVGQRIGKAVDGVVLTATLFNSTRKQPGLGGFDFSSVPAPLLFVHHVDDGCASTPYGAAKRLGDRFPLISVSGGLPPLSQPCEAMSAHGFLGKEPDTAGAIANWMLKQPHASDIR